MSPERYPHHPADDLEEEMIADRLHGGIENGVDKLSEDVEMINAIEARVAEENPSLEGLDVSALTAHDMVAVAERSIDEDMEKTFQKQAVEMVVTKGAREQLGKDQSSGENPIKTMALHGKANEVVAAIESYATHEPHTPEMTELAGAAAAVLDKTVEELGIDTDTGGTVEDLIDSRVETSANFMGNWAEAQRDRMQSEDFQAKYGEFVRNGAEGLTDERPTGLLVKATAARSDYLAQVDELPSTVDAVTDHVEYGPANSFNASPRNLGKLVQDDGEKRVAVFNDAEIDGRQLTDRQKDIIAAHEMYHGVLVPAGKNKEQVRAAFSQDAYYDLKSTDGYVDGPSQSYLFNAPELTARMAQLKNYFGMKGGEPFTMAHLEYARRHYVPDTGLDNSMTEFLTMAKDAEFVDAMNTFPV